METDSLYQLISALTQAEKREFTKSYSMKSRTQDYVRLFDLINRNPTKGRKAIKEKFGPCSNFPRVKSSLRNALIAFLVKQSGSPEKEVYKYLIGAKELLTRRSYQLSAYSIRKGKQIAWKYEYFDSLAALISFEKTLPEKFIDSEVPEEEARLISVNREKEELDALNKRMEQWPESIVVPKPSISLLETIIQDVKVRMTQPFLSSLVKANMIVLLRRAYSLLENWEMAAHYSQEYIKYIGELDAFVDSRESLTVKEYESQTYLLHDSQNWELLFKSLDRVKRLRFSSNLNEARAFFFHSINLISYSANVGDLKKGRLVVKEIKAKIDRFKTELSENEYLYICYHSIRFLFVEKQYKEAIRWTSRLLGGSYQSKAFSVLYPFLSLILILSHFEIGNIDVVERLMVSLKRHVKDKGYSYRFYPLLFASLKKILEAVPGESRTPLEDVYTRMIEAKTTPFEKRPFNYFDAASWLEAKLRGKDMADILQEDFLASSRMNMQDHIAGATS